MVKDPDARPATCNHAIGKCNENVLSLMSDTLQLANYGVALKFTLSPERKSPVYSKQDLYLRVS